VNVNKRAFLLGAGFSKNFGGFLGSEIRDRLFNRPVLVRFPKVKKLFWGDDQHLQAYEDLYESVHTGSAFGDGEKLAIQEALTQVLEDQEIEFSYDGPKRQYARLKLFDLLGEINAPAFVFTLNHDLMLEKRWSHSKALYVPGIFADKSGYCADINRFRGKILETRVLPDSAALKATGLGMHSDGGIYYVKLHGSMNFHSYQKTARPIIVMGKRKEEQLRREPLLNSYLDLFRDVLNSGGVKLFVCGYSFCDEHVNSVIRRAKVDASLEVFILDPASKSDLASLALVRAGMNVRDVINFHFPYRILDDLFPDGNHSHTAAWKEITDLYR